MFLPQNNISLNCWANSLAQSLRALTHIRDYINASYANDNNYGIAINNASLKHSGQQCAHEALQILLERVPLEIQRKFELTTEYINICPYNHKTSTRDTEYFVLFPPVLPVTFNQYLLKRESTIDTAKCDTCNALGITRIELLRKVSPIIAIVLNKFTQKSNLPYPHLLSIPTHPSLLPLNYELVAIIEHAGCAYSGHYWALCKDYNTNIWYTCNDTTIQQLPAPPNPTNESYILFYSQIIQKV